jgi:pheromone shutdown-related protein TraB
VSDPPAHEAFGESVRQIEHEGRQITIIGTAHVSKRSEEEVREVIAALRPDTVCVELDKMRYEALVDDSRWKKLDLFQVIRQGKVLFLLASLFLSSYQRRLGERLGVKPGAELVAAVESAEAVGATVILADRDVQITLKRTWANISFWNKLKLFGGLLVGDDEDDDGKVPKGDITAAQIEALKDKDHLNELMKDFAEALPEVKVPLIDERDHFLMSKIQEAPGKTIVAVVGAGHVEGILAHLGQPVDRDALSVVPPPSIGWRIFKWLIPVIILSAFAYGYTNHAGEDFANMLRAWILPNAIGAAVLAAVAGAKPLTVLTAAVASPITSLNPTIGAGMVAGLVEAWLRKPTVSDCEAVHDDIKTVRGLYRNQFTRVLLVVILASLGSALGAWVGATWVVALL